MMTARMQALQQGFNHHWQIRGPAFQAVAAELRLAGFRRGQAILAQGQRLSAMYILSSGLARYYYLRDDGRELNKSFVADWGVVSSITAIVAGDPVPFYVEALEDCQGAWLEYVQLERLAQEHAAWRALALGLAQQLAIKKERREAEFLLLSARARYEKFLAEQTGLEARLSNRQIASYLGITEVALSRIRRQLGMT